MYLHRGAAPLLRVGGGPSPPAEAWAKGTHEKVLLPTSLLRVSFDNEDELGPGTQQLVPPWSHHVVLDESTLPGMPARAVLGFCNSTHGVLYTADASSSSNADVFVSLLSTGERPKAVPHIHRNRTNFLYFVEAPAHFVGLPIAHGYNGFAANTREATIWRPIELTANVQHAARKLTFDRSRNTIGIWINQCYPHTRRHLIDELVSSALPVRSYGYCRHNTGELGTPAHELFSSVGMKECSTHRLMLSVENNNCVDWVSGHVLMALRCGAIPIIYQIDGLPDYRSLYGDFPHVNASRRGWQQEVEQLMRNDTAYREFVHRWRQQHRAQQPRNDGTAPLEDERYRGYHCDWFAARSRPPKRRLRNATISWQRCIYCDGEVPMNDDADCHDDRAPGRQLHVGEGNSQCEGRSYRRKTCPHQQEGYTRFSTLRSPEQRGSTPQLVQTVRRPKEPNASSLQMCEGDCDTDLHCAGSLFCFQRLSNEPVPGCSGTGTPGVDYCTDLAYVREQPMAPWMVPVLE